MLQIKILNLALAAWIICKASLAFGSEPNWIFVSSENDVQVYEGIDPDSSFLAFKGVKIIPTHISKVAGVLLTPDLEIRKKWVTGLLKTENLEIKSDREAFVYTSFKMPWPISNRDFVTHCTVDISPDKQQLTLEVRSVKHPKEPATVGVRGEIRTSRYLLKSLGPNSTEVTVMAQTDPKGSLPSWLVNSIQRYWPAATLKKLQDIAVDPSSAVYTGLQ